MVDAPGRIQRISNVTCHLRKGHAFTFLAAAKGLQHSHNDNLTKESNHNTRARIPPVTQPEGALCLQIFLESQSSTMVRLREIPRTATFAWSQGSAPPLIATGTRAGAVDADFSNETQLEIWDLDLGNVQQGVELQPVGSVSVDSRYARARL